MTDIKTDPKAMVCSFNVPEGNTDYLAELVEFAKTNTHLADYELADGAVEN